MKICLKVQNELVNGLLQNVAPVEISISYDKTALASAPERSKILKYL